MCENREKLLVGKLQEWVIIESEYQTVAHEKKFFFLSRQTGQVEDHMLATSEATKQCGKAMLYICQCHMFKATKPTDGKKSIWIVLLLFRWEIQSIRV